MKKSIIIVLLLSISNIFSQSWFSSMSDAKKVALVSSKLLFVDFTASWCGPCKMMERDVWSKDDIKKQMENFITVQIDIDDNREVAQKYGVNSIPNLFILDGNGKVIENIKGYKSKKFMNDFFKKYSINLSFLQNQLISYYKKTTYSAALRVANKYQIYSLYLDDKIKANFINLADDYLENALKLLKENKSKNKPILVQKINLYRLRSKLFLNKSKKVLKKLSKFNQDKIDNSNKSLFAFLNYVCYKQLNDDENSLKWYDKMNAKDIELSNFVLNK